MKRERGFTLVEVMVALGVMTIGAMALFSLQAQSTRANMHAREMTTAAQIAQTWIERLKLESSTWRASGALPATLAGVDTNAATFVALPVVVDLDTGQILRSRAFDYFGNELNPSNANDMARARYCAAFRLAWVYPGRAMRADVRVFWPRDHHGAAPKDRANDLPTDFPECQGPQALLNPGGQEIEHYHVVYLSTVLRPMLP